MAYLSTLIRAGLAIFAGLAITTAALAGIGSEPGEQAELVTLEAEEATEPVVETEADLEDAQDVQEGPDEDASPVAHAVWGVISTWEGERGCAFGMAVASAAKGANGEGDAPDASACDRGAEGRARGEANGEEGRERGGAEAQAGRERGEENRQRGLERAEQSRQSGESEPEDESD